MTDRAASISNQIILAQFRAARVLFRNNPVANMTVGLKEQSEHSPPSNNQSPTAEFFASHISPAPENTDAANKESTKQNEQNVPKSSAQVAFLVSPQAVSPKSDELKLGVITDAAGDDDNAETNKKRRPNPLTVRLSDQERQIIRDKAQSAGCSINGYVRASALGSDYKPPTDPELVQALLKLNRELTSQGNNLNQIAHHLNSGRSSPAEGSSLLAMISRSMLQTHKAICKALSWGKTPEP